MDGKQEIINVSKEELVEKVDGIKKEGYRLVQIGCTKIPDGFEINYSFDREYKFLNLRVTIAADGDVPSITGVYWGAFLYENEIHDLFGINVKDININYDGNLYKTAVKAPFGCDIK